MAADTDFAIFYSEHHAQHNPAAGHEIAARADRIHTALTAAALGPVRPPVDFGMAPVTAVHSRGLIYHLQTAFARLAAHEHLPQPAAPHSFAVRELAGHVPRNIWGQLGYYCSDSTTPILAGTWESAYAAAQVALTAADFALSKGGAAYALCRPPGHHAYTAMYGGYCYLNNAAIAAHWLTQQGQRVAIVDVDYHHGNGTQAVFYDRDDVFFCSLHADPNDEYPYFCGFAHERGAAAGYGHNLNLPLPLGTDDEAYLAALAFAVTAVAQFAPDLLVVSLGLDTFAGDPEGGFMLTTGAFARIGAALRQVGRPVLVVQEGGYLLDELGINAVKFLRGLLGA